MEKKELKKNMNEAIKASIKAGDEILKIYESDFNVEEKQDKSPLTLADKNSHETIINTLKSSDLPIMSEEGKELTFDERKDWKYFWMIDPLDGTKEFIKKNGEFTVNIALIEKNKPIGGVIHVPDKDLMYFALKGEGAYKLETAKKNNNYDFDELISNAFELPHTSPNGNFTVVASRSHMSEETEKFIEEQKEKYGEIDTTSIGSSLKLCLVAEGKADAYPRFAPTMEWDTAAGQAIAEAAGKEVIEKETGDQMVYNKENLTNPWFIVQ